MKKPKCDCSGWATRNNLVCGDGRVIRKDAFADCDGTTVPLVWNHQHNDPLNVLGHALLENRQDGVYAYCTFNETESGKAAKLLVQHGDVEALSIYANQLKQQNRDVIHGMIREVSLVVAGANPGAFIDFVDLAHGEGAEQEVIIGTGEGINLAHAEDDKDDDGENPKDTPDDKKEKPEDDDETVEEVFNSLTDKQKNVVYALIGQALEEGGSENNDDPEDKTGGKQTAKHSEGGDNTMKHNVFDKPDDNRETVLSHSAQEEIISNAKTKSIGTLQGAMKLYAEQHSDTLKHGIDDIEALFPDYRDLRPGAPEVVSRDQGWVTVVMNKVHKSPISRIRTKQMDARRDGIRAKGYKKGSLKTPSGNMKLITRTTDPQTVYITDAMHRDDKIDITDFDVVEYQYGVMRQTLNEELAVAIMIGDGREEGDEHKIYQEHIRSIWNDDDLYAIHYDVNVEAAKEELQGSNTSVNFGENYIYAEAVITASLYSREQYKGTGTPDFYCDPHLLNVMLLARDLNGRRIYDSKSDLAKALNVNEIYTAEQFAGLARTNSESKQKKLLGIFVNLADYTIGATKGGEITRFNQFDIDFNQEKYMIETRLSGALTRIQSAIVLEEPVGA
jgi:hypothetical protein|nr:MAG TPA: major capsid protein [Bacteriophage sp.]